MLAPLFKAEVTHGGATTTLTKTVSWQVTRRENGFTSAILTFTNTQSKLYPNIVDRLDTINCYFKFEKDSSWTKIFAGSIYSVHPHLSGDEEILKVNARGLGYALDATHCNVDYGSESSNPAMATPKQIWDDVVDNYVNKSFGGDATGYSLTNTYIADIASGLSITYLNNPYRVNSDVLNRVCQIVSAYEGGSAGPHWMVDTSGNLIINTIGAHENPTQWPDWWNTDEAGSTLKQGLDFATYVISSKAEAFANNILFLTDFRRPGYDYWTNNHSGLWGTVDCDLLDEATIKVVGSHSLRITSTHVANPAFCYYPSSQDAGWDVTKWGSINTVPVIGFYGRRNMALGGTAGDIRLFTTDYNTDYFKIYQLDKYIASQDEWYNLSFRIGPHYLENPLREGDTTVKYKWYEFGSPDWTDINGIAFRIPSYVGDDYLYIDDLHFGQGKIIREAKNSTNITANKEKQLIFISKTAMDDSGIATDDSGMAARYAYAELLRRQKIPLTIQFTVRIKPSMLPGQKIHVHAAEAEDGTFNVDKDFRILRLIHGRAGKNVFTAVTATDDLTNSFPITTMTQRQLLTEYVLVNNREALDMKSGDVDLLIPRLTKDYPS